MKILIVDDDAVSLTAMNDLLTMDGHIVEHASNGMGALSMLKVMIPDIIVMDWRMPMIDGRDLIKALRADPKFRKMPILVLTAMCDEDLRDELNGIRDIANPISFLHKPVPIETIKETIHDLSKMSV